MSAPLCYIRSLFWGRLKSAITSFNSWNHEMSIGNYFKYYNEIDHR